MVKTRQQMAEEYGISCKTLVRRLKQAGVDIPGGLIRPVYQIRIYNALGLPMYMPSGVRKDWERVLLAHTKRIADR